MLGEAVLIFTATSLLKDTLNRIGDLLLFPNQL
jgi:hypothetical protein